MDMRFAKRLKVCMIEKEVSRESLAEETGISPSSISAYCAGRRLPGWRHLMKLKNALNVPIEDLV